MKLGRFYIGGYFLIRMKTVKISMKILSSAVVALTIVVASASSAYARDYYSASVNAGHFYPPQAGYSSNYSLGYTNHPRVVHAPTVVYYVAPAVVAFGNNNYGSHHRYGSGNNRGHHGSWGHKNRGHHVWGFGNESVSRHGRVGGRH